MLVCVRGKRLEEGCHIGNAVQQLTSCWTETGMDCVGEDERRRGRGSAEGVMQEEGTSDARGVVSALTSAGSILIFDLLRNSCNMLSPLGTMCCSRGRCCACYVCICASKSKCITNVCRWSIRSECEAWRRGSCITSVGGQLQQCWVELSLCAAICFLV
jgi:hypothetical protein